MCKYFVYITYTKQFFIHDFNGNLYENENLICLLHVRRRGIVYIHA